MRTTLICLLLAFFFFSDLFAQGGTRPPGVKKPPVISNSTQLPSVEVIPLTADETGIFSFIDVNKDKIIDIKKELQFTKPHTAIDQEMMINIYNSNKNNDGFIDKSEFLAGLRIPRMLSPESEKIFKMLDLDSDKYLDIQYEILGSNRISQSQKTSYKNLDKNRDKFISKIEFAGK